MSAFARDFWRYHHWPAKKNFWTRARQPGNVWPHGQEYIDPTQQGVSDDFVGFDNRASPQNLEKVRYHYWPESRSYILRKRKIPPRQTIPHYNKGEKQEYDFMHTNNYTTRTAPFGTSDTPSIAYKIIAGKPVHVLEGVTQNSPRLNDQPVYTGPRIHQLDGVTEKPNEVDPRILNESTKGYYTAQQFADDTNNEKFQYRKLPTLDQYSSHVHGKPTHANPISYRGNRPDSKSLARFQSLPPIEAHRGRNNDSTVFERESWLKDYGEPKLAKDTEYKTHYDPNTLHGERRDQSYPNSERKLTPGVRESYNDADNVVNGHAYHNNTKTYSDQGLPPAMNTSAAKREILSYLPPGDSLPTDAVRFSTRQKQDLVDIAAEEMRGVTTDDLKGAYQTLVTLYDRNLNGWSPYSKVYEALMRDKADPKEDTLRCVASMFVDPNYPGMVNYENIIRFLNDVIKQTHTGIRYSRGKEYGSSNVSPRSTSDQQQPPKQQYYSHRAPSPVRNISISREKETAVLLQRTSNQLGTNKIDIERLVQSFQSYDSGRREMLSVSEIKNVLFDNSITLEDGLVNEILSKIETANRDGQYSWRKFVEFLERVKPVRTSLEISYNKRPLEMAKQYPQPLDSWPHAKDSPRRSPQPYSHSPRSPVKSNWQNTGSRPNGPSGTSDEIWRHIHAIEEEIKELEEKTKVLRQGLESDYRGDEWDSKLIQLGGFLYRKDEDKYRASGYLPFDQITSYTKNYNSYANMRVPDDVIDKIAYRYKNERNMVDIERFLDDLGNRRRWN